MPGVVEEYVNRLKEEARIQESEMQGEARAEREEIHISQFHARYESPSPDASEYVQNSFAEESEAFVEKQLRTVDRQFPDATEVERLRITEDKLGLGQMVSERIQTAYGVQTEGNAEIREQAFNEGLSVTRSHLEEVYFNNKTSNGWDAYLAKSEPWSKAEERGFVEEVAHRENRFIAIAQATPGSKYATDESYRHGAREAVRQFSHEHDHRLKEKESEQPRETNRESIRIKFG
jgi:hypothetical protein